MSLRKFMHERNIYKQEPNFKKLAILYPEFRKIAINDIGGKVHINFKNEESLRVLTNILLKHDFDLNVEIPKKNLVPALPLRLNYILWIEDLLNHAGMKDFTTIHGIDIGTGAVCIYPLLFSKLHQIKMIGTDIDPESINSATININNNNLQDLIRVVLVNKETILDEILQDDKQYSFLMCNPPFFETDKGLNKKVKEEPPRNASTGNETEMEVKGGEKEFILQLINESIKYKNKVKIFTTMFGQKSSLAFLNKTLKVKEISNVTWTEFCQGFTKRWGIAWTFAAIDEVNLTTAPFIRTRTEVLKLKKDKTMEIVFPAKENFSSLDDLITTIKKSVNELQLEMKEIQFDSNDEEDDKTHPCWVCKLTCYNDTWSHARRKRRMAMHQEASKKQRLDHFKFSEETTELESNSSNPLESQINSDPLLICTLLVEEKSKNDQDNKNSEISEGSTRDKKMFRICLLFENGHGGKLSLDTLRQYFVNKLNIREFFHKQHPSKPNKKKRKKKKLNETTKCENDSNKKQQ